MQTSKIKIGELYALKSGDNVVRCKVTAITTVTRRTKDKASPADTTNTVEGVIHEADQPGTVEERTRKFGPDILLGHYTEYEELQRKTAEESAHAEALRKAREEHRLRLTLKFYEITGITVPNNLKEYKAPFRENYGNVEIQEDQYIVALIEAIEKLQEQAKSWEGIPELR